MIRCGGCGEIFEDCGVQKMSYDPIDDYDEREERSRAYWRIAKATNRGSFYSDEILEDVAAEFGDEDEDEEEEE